MRKLDATIWLKFHEAETSVASSLLRKGTGVGVGEKGGIKCVMKWILEKFDMVVSGGSAVAKSNIVRACCKKCGKRR